MEEKSFASFFFFFVFRFFFFYIFFGLSVPWRREMQQRVELYYYAGRGRERKTCDSRKQRVRVLPILPIINLLVSVERPIRALNALPFAPLCRGSLRFYRARVGERDTKMSLVCHPFPPPLAVTLCEPCVAERIKNTVFFLSLPFFHVGVLILVFLPFPPFFFYTEKNGSINGIGG